MDYTSFERLYLFEHRTLCSELESARRHHNRWFTGVNRVLVCRDNPSAMDLEEDAHLHCRLGRWYYSIEDSVLAELPSFRDLGAAHAAVHRSARELMLLAQQGAPITPERYDRFIRDSDELLRLMRRLRERLNDNLYISAQVLGRLFLDAPQRVLITAPDRTVLYTNRTFDRASRLPRDELVGRVLGSICSSMEAAPAADLWSQVAEQGFWCGELQQGEGEGPSKILSISAIRDDQGRLVHYLVIAGDAPDLAAHEAELERLAHLHPLTHLPNRLTFLDRLDELLVEEGDNRSIAVMVVDLDGFRAINERFGREAGDRLLSSAAERLQEGLLTPELIAYLAYLHGDVFVLVVSAPESVEETEIAAQSVIAALEEPFTVDGERLRVTPSIGISLFREHASDAAGLVRAACDAIYDAKMQGGNRYCFFRPVPE